MPMGGGSSSGSSSATSITIPKAKKTEKDAFAYASAYNPILADYLGYEVNYGGRTADVQAQIDDINQRMAATTDKTELKTLKGQLKAAQKDLKGVTKDASSDFTLTKRAPTPEELQQQEFQKQLTGTYQNQLLTGDISPQASSQLETYYGAQQSQMEDVLRRSALQGAASRGLSISDTPIGDAYLRNLAMGTSSIQANKAQSYLGLRSDELNRAAGYMSYLDAYKQLNQFQNPLTAGGYATNLALGMYAPQAAPGGSGLGGLGGLLQGAGSLTSSLFGKNGAFGGSTGSTGAS